MIQLTLARLLPRPASVALTVLVLSAAFPACQAPTSSAAAAVVADDPSLAPGARVDEGRRVSDAAHAADPAPAPTAATAAIDFEEKAFLALLNAYRAQVGAPSLRISPALTRAADWLSSDMATRDYFSHTDRLGREFSTRVKAFGFTGSWTIGENIAAGNAGAQGTFTQWRNSPGHDENMRNPSYRVIGIARAQDPSSTYGWYWTTDFGGDAKE